MLDVACGGGRHTRHFYALGHPVTAVDIDLGRMRDLAQQPGIELVEADLEGGPWPFSGRAFAAVVVTNYLWRPLFPALMAAIETGGLLLYETFAEGNSRLADPPVQPISWRRGSFSSACAARFKSSPTSTESWTIRAPRQFSTSQRSSCRWPRTGLSRSKRGEDRYNIWKLCNLYILQFET